MGSIADKLNYTIDAKLDIQDACLYQGVYLPDDATFGEYGKYIRLLNPGGGGESPKLNMPTAKIKQSKYLIIFDKDVNGIFSTEAKVFLNDEEFKTFQMENGEVVYEFGDNELKVGDVLAITVSNKQFKSSNPFVKTLEKYDFVQYGDGSLNLVKNGYNDHIMVNEQEIETPITYPQYFAGNLNGIANWAAAFKGNSGHYKTMEHPLFTRATDNYNTFKVSDNGDCFQSWQNVLAGTHTYNNVNCDATLESRTCILNIYGGSLTPTNTLSGMCFNVEYNLNGSTYIENLTFKEMVEIGIIEPMVIIWSGTTSGSYYYPNILNTYTGGSSGSGSYATYYSYFTLKEGNKINYFQLTATNSTSTSYPDGMLFVHYSTDVLTISYRD